MSRAPNFSHSNADLPVVRTTTAALQSATMTAAQLTGAEHVLFINTGTTPANLTLPLATEVASAQNSRDYILEIRNNSSGANTATIVTNTGWTLSGTMTIAQNTTRRFAVTFGGSGAAATLTSMGLSQAGA